MTIRHEQLSLTYLGLPLTLDVSVEWAESAADTDCLEINSAKVGNTEVPLFLGEITTQQYVTLVNRVMDVMRRVRYE